MNNFHTIPTELVSVPNFLLWRNETRDGKPTKVPYDAKRPESNAKTNDPDTWASFERAVEVAEDPLEISGRFDGIGIVLPPGLVGIDFDGVIQNGAAEPFVLDIIKQMGNPYCEVTPSLTGLRVFVECQALPKGNRKFSAKQKGVDKYGAEIYIGGEGGRYLTVTGDKRSGDGIPKISDLSLPYFLISQFASEKFKKLWMGDSSEYENDDSRADLALLSILARHFDNDPTKIENVFSKSPCGHREKWVNRKDYRDRTIAKTIRDGKQPVGTFVESGTSFTPPRSEIISIRACDVVPVPIEFLWEPYLQKDALNAFYGNPSGGKGNTGTDVIARLTTGRPFPTETTTDRKPMNCVILAAEEGVESTIVPRLIAAGADLKRVRIVRSIRCHDRNDKIEDRLITFQTDMAELKADLLQHPEERYLFIDPITNYVGDINFNQDGEVRPVLTLLVQLAEELKITITIVGHFNKNSNVASALDKPGGGRAWTAVPRACWGFFRHPDNKDQRMMVNLKLNNAKESETGLLFTIGERIIGNKPDGKPWGVSYVEWGGTTDTSADEIVATEHPEAQRDNKGVKFLTAALKNGVRKAAEIYKEADDESVSESTLDRAVRRIGVLKFKMRDGWFWQHPDDRTPIPDAARDLNKEARVRRESQERVPPESVPPPQQEPEFGFSDVEVSR